MVASTGEQVTPAGRIETSGAVVRGTVTRLRRYLKRPRFLAALTGRAAPEREQPGQGLVELALVALLLAFTGLGAMEMGRAYHAALTASHAARDGARVATDPEVADAQIKSAITEAADPLTPSDYTIDRDLVGYTDVEVTVTIQFETSVPLVSELWDGGPLNITRTATARMEEK
jgi:Flp pilus assembly protein TadG